jgi:hypothetical protein
MATVREFVDAILNTSVAGAKDWIQGSIDSVPIGCWESFLAQAITHYSARIILERISHYCNLKHNPSKDFMERWAAFKEEFWQKAATCGVPLASSPHDGD